MSPPIEDDPAVSLARVKSGDRCALGSLLERHRNYLHLLVRLQVGKRLRSKLDVEDLVQEACLEAHRGIERFQGATSSEFLAWLRQIVAGVLANQVRRYFGTKRRDLRLEQSLADDPDRSSVAPDGGYVAPYSSPSHVVLKREQGLILADALATLPDDYREVIILRQLENLPFPEVASRMGRSVVSVKHLWVRALPGSAA